MSDEGHAEEDRIQVLFEPGSYGSWNVGDLAMSQVAIERIRRRFPSAVMYGFTSDPSAFERVFQNVHPVSAGLRSRALSPGRLESAVLRRLPEFLSSFAKPLEFFRDVPPLRSIVRDSSLVAVLGMGGINDVFSDHALSILKLLRLARLEGKATVLFGQGLGPINNPALRAEAQRVFPEIDLIGVREPLYSPRVAESMGAVPERVHVTGDDALGLANRYTPVLLGDALGVNVRVSAYSAVQCDILEVIRRLLSDLKRQLRAQLVPVPISFHSQEADLSSCERLGVRSDEAVPCIPSEVIKQVGRCRLVITGAYHAAVFALAQGIPVVGISNSEYYDQKFLGLAAMFPGNCEMVSMLDPEFEVNLRRAALTRWESAPQCREVILQQAKLQIQKSEIFFGKVFELLEKGTTAALGRAAEVRLPEKADYLTGTTGMSAQTKHQGAAND